MWGELPTWSWWKEEIIRDEHVLTLDESLPDGEYTLYVGMYDAASGIRAPVVTEGKRLPKDRVLLELIRHYTKSGHNLSFWETLFLEYNPAFYKTIPPTRGDL
jgi:hypothetical protein